MAALTVTAANVDAGAGEIGYGVAGEAITAGQTIYYDRVNQQYMLAAADTEAEAKCVGVAVCNAAAGQIVTFQKSGSYTAGATLTKGTFYVISPTAGGISPVADLQSGDFVTLFGVASSTSEMKLLLIPTGIAL